MYIEPPSEMGIWRLFASTIDVETTITRVMVPCPSMPLVSNGRMSLSIRLPRCLPGQSCS